MYIIKKHEKSNFTDYILLITKIIDIHAYI